MTLWQKAVYINCMESLGTLISVLVVVGAIWWMFEQIAKGWGGK